MRCDAADVLPLSLVYSPVVSFAMHMGLSTRGTVAGLGTDSRQRPRLPAVLGLREEQGQQAE